jgi:hypothetical protein
MENEEFAKITDKGECLSTLYTFPQIQWPKPFLKSVACKDEWAKEDFYPSNGLVGEIAYIIKKDMSQRIDIDIYILKINDKFYVPMSRKGLKIISKEDYLLRKPKNNIRGMDLRQEKLYDGIDDLNSNINDIFDFQEEDDNFNNDLPISKYYDELKKIFEGLCAENASEFTIRKNEEDNYCDIIYDFDNFEMGIISLIIRLEKNGNLASFIIKGLNPEISQLAKEAEKTKKVFNVPIFKFMLMDENRMIVTMLVMPKNW